MLSRVISLRTKLKNIKGTAKDKVSGSGITNVIDEKKIEAANISAISESIKLANSILNNTSELVSGVKSKSDFESARLILGSSADGQDAKTSAPDKMAWKVIFEFAGNKVIHCVPKERVSGKDAYELGAKYSVKTEKVDKSGGGDIDTLKEDQIKKVLDGVEVTVKSLMDQKSTVAAIQSSMDKVINSIQSLASSSSKEDEDVGSRSTKARSTVTAIGNGSIKIVTLVGSEVTRSCQAYLTYAERSIDAYSEDNDKAKK